MTTPATMTATPVRTGWNVDVTSGISSIAAMSFSLFAVEMNVDLGVGWFGLLGVVLKETRSVRSPPALHFLAPGKGCQGVPSGRRPHRLCHITPGITSSSIPEKPSSWLPR